MKKTVARRSASDLLQTHPIRRAAAGWFFKVREASPGHWIVEGLDAWGRRVAVEGGDPDALLSEAESQARRISEGLELD